MLFLSTLFISFLLIESSPTLGEKKNTTLDLLCPEEWQAIIENIGLKTKLTLSFSKRQQTYYLEYESKSGMKKYSETSDYYLSETPDSTFDKKKVGKIKNGKYLIVRAHLGDKIYRIHILTSTYLNIELIGGAIHEYHKKEKRRSKVQNKPISKVVQ